MHYFHLKTRLIYNSKTRQFNRTTRDYKHMPGYKQMKEMPELSNCRSCCGCEALDTLL